MINKLLIDNLKSINHIEILPKSFNMFTGTNSSGKSTALQAMLLMSQNLENPYGLNGPLTAIGEYREAKNFNIKKDKIIIEISNEIEKISLQIDETSGVEIVGQDKNSSEEALVRKISFSNSHFHYLSCNRIGSRDLFSKNRTIHRGVGITGEYSIAYLSEHGSEPLDEKLIKDNSNLTLLAQVNHWLKYIVNSSINTEAIVGTEAVRARYEIVEGRSVRPQNVGSGISYLISIIVLCLASKEDDILVIENPEIHLHPLSQSRLCEFLYFIAESGRQLFIETHSDHLFNAVRAGIATRTMNRDIISINFFKLGSDNCTRNYDIQIGSYGAVENQLPNLFDQFQNDLDKMIGVLNV